MALKELLVVEVELLVLPEEALEDLAVAGQVFGGQKEVLGGQGLWTSLHPDRSSSSSD